MRRNLHYLNSLLLPLMAFVALSKGGWWGLFPWAVVFGVVAIIELFLPENTDNYHDKTEALPAGILGAHLIAHGALLGYWGWLFSRGHYTWWEGLLSALAVGFNSGASGIVVAHEMLHRKGKWWQAGARFLLACAGNLYFYVTHIRMHHRYVGTELDYSSARQGESLYAFLWRTIRGQFRWAWHSEKERLEKLGLSPWTLKNFMLQTGVGFVLLIAYLTLCGGLWGALAMILQAGVAHFLLEYVNYIEHYGLARQIEEPIRPWHSWESNKYLSRFFLVDLTRHSDHHLHGAKSYHTLNALEQAPKLPTGYAGMLYLALIPPLWQRIMDAKLPAPIKIKAAPPSSS
ncbi:MAG: alkane 1-monooxygenase [Bacteroidia bacterium]|nr:alkane 1-monooxygenase [Bacteroidia bacterium]MDW8014792.1 alkane 1-monooxygenase [Bacteroidia bacterium]